MKNFITNLDGPRGYIIPLKGEKRVSHRHCFSIFIYIIILYYYLVIVQQCDRTLQIIVDFFAYRFERIFCE
jgi:hypothetical protein